MTRHKRRRKGSTQEALDARGGDIARDGIVLDLGSNRYKVSSQSVPDAYYEVTVMDGCWKCTCPYHVRRGDRCKHIRAVQGIVEKIRECRLDVLRIGDPGVVCVSCKLDDCKHRETREKKNGVSERYVCRDCNKKFTHNPGFVGMHYDPETIIDALEDVAVAKSHGEAARSLKKKGKSPDPSTVWRWNVRFGGLLRKLSNTVAHRAGYEWCADEVHYKSMGKGMWLFGVMDAKSRFVVHYESSTTKFGYDAEPLFGGSIELAGKEPDAVTTDALSGFAKGLAAALTGGKRSRTIHRKDAGIRKRHANNNAYERFNGTVKDRIKRVRGFRSELPALHVLFLAYYNLFRPHSGIGGKTPAEALGVIIEGPNKWLTAIRHAALFCA